MSNGWNTGGVTYSEPQKNIETERRVWFKKSRAAEYLDVSVDYLEKLIKLGYINKVYKLGRKMEFFKREDLDAVFEQHSEIFVLGV